MEQTKSQLDIKSEKRKFTLSIIGGAIVGLLITTFLFQFCTVSGSSMEPTLKGGDVLLINKISKDYDRYDIVVAKTDGKLLIKRLIGLPGETIQICDNEIYINGSKIEDVVDCEIDPRMAENEIHLSENEYFLLGDNRPNSYDCRDIGPVNENQIVGEIMFVK